MFATYIQRRKIALRMNKVNVANSSSTKLLRLSSGLSEKTLPGVEVIGAAYNPFLDYANTDSITVQIFDWNAAKTKTVPVGEKEYLVPEVVDVIVSGSAVYNNTTGDSISTYQSDLSTSTSISGSYNFFSGSLGVDYSSESLTHSENSFSRIQQSISLWSLRLATGPSLRPHLKKDFRDYLDNLPQTPEAVNDFFNRYGSHFLSGVVMGGRTVFASATNKLKIDRSYSLEVTAQASYKGLTGQLSAEDKTKYQQSMDSFTSNSESNHFVRGGDGVKALSAFDGKEGFDAWKSSVEESPDFVDFVTTIPMAEMWRLCATEEQSKYLETYFYSVWGPAQSTLYQLYADYIDEMVVITGGSSTIEPPQGYTKIPYDLNAGSGGDFIYLCYHKSSYNPKGNNKKCVNKVTIIYGQDTPTPTGYIKLPQDLNKGAGGEYIYLCYLPIEYNNDAAIKSVTVIGGNNPDIPPPYGFEKVPGDLNKGAGGEFVYVCTSLIG